MIIRAMEQSLSPEYTGEPEKVVRRSQRLQALPQLSFTAFTSRRRSLKSEAKSKASSSENRRRKSWTPKPRQRSARKNNLERQFACDPNFAGDVNVDKTSPCFDQEDDDESVFEFHGFTDDEIWPKNQSTIGQDVAQEVSSQTVDEDQKATEGCGQVDEELLSTVKQESDDHSVGHHVEEEDLNRDDTSHQITVGLDHDNETQEAPTLPSASQDRQPSLENKPDETKTSMEQTDQPMQNKDSTGETETSTVNETPTDVGAQDVPDICERSAMTTCSVPGIEDCDISIYDLWKAEAEDKNKNLINPSGLDDLRSVDSDATKAPKKFVCFDVNDSIIGKAETVARQHQEKIEIILASESSNIPNPGTIMHEKQNMPPTIGTDSALKIDLSSIPKDEPNSQICKQRISGTIDTLPEATQTSTAWSDNGVANRFPREAPQNDIDMNPPKEEKKTSKLANAFTFQDAFVRSFTPLHSGDCASGVPQAKPQPQPKPEPETDSDPDIQMVHVDKEIDFVFRKEDPEIKEKRRITNLKFPEDFRETLARLPSHADDIGQWPIYCGICDKYFIGEYVHRAHVSIHFQEMERKPAGDEFLFFDSVKWLVSEEKRREIYKRGKQHLSEPPRYY